MLRRLFLVSVALAQAQAVVNTFPLSSMGPYSQQFPYSGNTIQGPTMMYQPVAGIQVMSPSAPGIYPYPSSEVRMSPRFNFGAGAEQFQNDQRMPLVQKEVPQPQLQTGPTRIIPPFLKSASKEEQDKFYAIVQNPTWSGAEKNERIEEFMRTMSSESQATYSDYDGRWSAETKARREKVHKAVEEMSLEAKTQFQKVSALMTAPGVPENERLQRIQELYGKMSSAVRKEFDEKLTNL
ncbi:unnamed protein product [Caenorhabditis auriculariae]|uniref:SXP/RAL-2 family protein Ani s 5-like cation-binding domain-containing protein n=1 Tax=Caenorhabditis auriculariae TaxID=2777116 RepID=A0A8S1HIZ7_9PELO|nr:unnamed protein product [Caenorhabditis auriculariae]